MSDTQGKAAGPDRSEPPLGESGALEEAMRCLQCFQAPCTEKCPAHIPIPRFIRMLRSGNVRGAAEAVREANPVAHACGEACPDAELCRTACTRAKIDGSVRIRQLHRFATREDVRAGARAPVAAAAGGKRVAVVGAGPAGLACARTLALAGVAVDLYERDAAPGGLLRTQVPAYRLPGEIVARDVEGAVTANVTLRAGEAVDDAGALARSHDALFVGAGLYGETRLGVPGEDLAGVVSAAAFMTAVKGGAAVRGDVVVVGGGNVAIDCAVSAADAGAASVAVCYRRSFGEMPAWKRELDMAMAAGVRFVTLAIPAGFEGEGGKLRRARFLAARLGEPGSDGRRVPVAVEGSAYAVACDTAVVATGQRLDESLARLYPNAGGRTLPAAEGTLRVAGNVFAGGDAVGRGTIVEAAGDGKRAAEAIIEFLGKPGTKSREGAS